MVSPRIISFLISVTLIVQHDAVQATNIAPEGTPIFGVHTTVGSSLGTPYDHVNPPSVLNDGSTNAAVDSWIGNTVTDHSYIGVTWAGRRSDEITQVTVDIATFLDGGWFGANGQSPGPGNALDVATHFVEPTVQVTADGGATWTNIAANSNYPSRLDGHEIGGGGNPNPTNLQATWTLVSPQSDIDGIRLIGPDGGNAGDDSNGFFAASEIAVEAAAVATTGVLTASPAIVEAGGSSMLGWDLPDGIATATLTKSDGTLIQNISADTGSISVTPAATTTYFLEHGIATSVVTVFAGESLVITEFVAANSAGLEDEDGDTEDWIEVYNASNTAIDTGGWRLTDDAASAGAWILPTRTLAPGEFLIVFASGKNRAPASGELHSDFKLSADGEDLVLRDPGGAPVSQFLAYGQQLSNFAFGIPMSGTTAQANSPAYFGTPTPGAVNNAGSAPGPIIEAVTQNIPPQPAGSPLVVSATVSSITAQVTGVALHHRRMFGVDSSLPMLDGGSGGDLVAGDGIYSATIPGSQFVAGEMARWYVTATESSGESARRPRFESPTGSDEYYGTIGADPSITSQLPVMHWFVENPNAATTVAGTRASVYYGGEFYDNIFSRQRGHFGSSTLPKKSFKFDFNDGDHFRFHPDERRVDEINLNTTYSDKAYIRRILAWDLYEAAGVPGSMAFMVRVEQNGVFWGVSNFIEQPDRDLLRREPLLDDDGALYKMFNETTNANSGVEKKTRRDEGNADMQALVSGVAIGSAVRDTFLWDNIDVPAAINFLAASRLMHENDDQAKNYYLFRNTTTTGEWTFVPWDKDLTWGRNYTRAGDNGNGGLFASLLNDTIWADNDTTAPFPGTGNASPSHPFFGDSGHTKNDGPFCRLSDAILDDPVAREMYLRRLRTLMDELLSSSNTPVAERYLETRIEELYDLMASDVALDRAIWASPNPPFGAEQTFRQAIDVIKDDYLPRRRQHFFETHTNNEVVLVDEPANATTLVPFPSNGGDALGLTWTQRNFVPSAAWIDGTTGVGFEASFSNRYDPLIETDIIAALDDDGDGSRDNSSAFIRIPFSASEPQLSNLNHLELQLRYDDGFIAYINGVEVARDNAPAGATWNSSANGQPNDDDAELLSGFSLDYAALQAGSGEITVGSTNVLAIHGLNASNNSSDMLISPRLVLSSGAAGGDKAGIPPAQTGSPPIGIGVVEFNPTSGDQDHEFVELTNGNAVAVDVSGWQIEGGIQHILKPGTVISAGTSLFLTPNAIAFRQRTSSPTGGERRLAQGNYTGHLSNFGETLILRDASGQSIAGETYSGSPTDAQLYLVISEIMYHPTSPDAEYIELTNISESITLDLGGSAFTGGFSFEFPDGASLTPGARALVVYNVAAFESAHGAGLPIAGVFSDGRLSNGGEKLKLEDSGGSTVRDFSYDDELPWPTAADGGGYSLVLINPATNPDHGNPANWRLSVGMGGSPGAAATTSAFSGDPNEDADGDGVPALVEHALGTSDLTGDGSPLSIHGGSLSFVRDLAADDVRLQVEVSTDLEQWFPAPHILQSQIHNADGTVTETWTAPGPAAESRQFLRLRIDLAN